MISDEKATLLLEALDGRQLAESLITNNFRKLRPYGAFGTKVIVIPIVIIDKQMVVMISGEEMGTLSKVWRINEDKNNLYRCDHESL